jgi:hypothetical protein
LIASSFVLERYRDLMLVMIALWMITGIFFAILPGVYLLQGPRAPKELLSTEQRTLQQLEHPTEEVRRIADAVDRLEKRTGGPSQRS